MTDASYPADRPRFFAHRYCRLLTKTCAAQEIGHAAFTLCVVIAHQEDAKRYKGAVTFFNEQLMSLVGVAKWEALDHARDRAVAAGWLRYIPGNRGLRQPGRYWVTIPPGLDGLADAPCDESQSPAKEDWVESQSPIQYPAKGDREGDREGDRAGDREGEHSTLPLFPGPSPEREAAGAAVLRTRLMELIDGWNRLGDTIVRNGNGARRDPPAKAVVSGWTKATKNAEQAPHLENIPAVLAAIRGAKFCHGQGWFTLPWIFGKNDKQEFNICRLMAGAHNVASNGRVHELLDDQPELFAGTRKKS